MLRKNGLGIKIQHFCDGNLEIGAAANKTEDKITKYILHV